jgi:hypothetical protein
MAPKTDAPAHIKLSNLCFFMKNNILTKRPMLARGLLNIHHRRKPLLDSLQQEFINA